MLQLTNLTYQGFGIPCPGGGGGGEEQPPPDCSSCDSAAMAIWSVAQPYINLHLDDTPLGYHPSRGLPVNFRLSYRQRDTMAEDPAIFGVGTNWTASGRVFLLDKTGVQSGWLRLHRGGSGAIDNYLDYYVGTPQFYNGSILTTPDSGLTYQIEYADGSKDIFAKTFVNSTGDSLLFLTAKLDPTGNTLTYNYSSNPNIVRLTSVTDPDSRNTQFYYENSNFTNLITKVVDPFSRTNLLQYDAAGYLTNIVDVAGLTSGFVYDAGARRSWITNLITAYGTTVFKHGGVNAETAGFYDGSNQVNRFVEITQPNGGKHLYLYRQDASSIMASTNASVPVTSPFANTLDNSELQQRNSFHWEPLQHIGLSTNYLFSGNVTNLTSNDYVFARLRHWLVGPAAAPVSRVVSLDRAAGPDASTSGLMTWYDYAGKAGGNNSNGTSALPLLEARVLPDGSTWFERHERNSRGNVTNLVSTYSTVGGSALRTNLYLYASDGIDLVRRLGPQGEQVVSNHFNAYHQPLASYNALNEATLYSYNTNHQITSHVSPSGLTTAYVYFTSGTDANRLEKIIEVEISRTNSYNYYTDGLVFSHTDERGLTTTRYWDQLERLTGVAYPDGTTTSNIYTALDITATKDRIGAWSFTAYNSVRLKVAETNVNGVVTRYGYCECGALSDLTNAWNTAVQQVTTYDYDLQGNRTYVDHPDGTVVNWYNSLRQRERTDDGSGWQVFQYNNQGLLVASTNAFGTLQTNVFDADDQPIYVTDVNGLTTTTTFDLLGRLLTRMHPDGGVERFGYSARGLIAYTNQLNQVTLSGYDVARRKIAETNANLEVILYTNNAAGDLISLTDGKNQTTRWNYDAYGRVTNKLDQAGTEILRYKYDANSRLTNRWSAAKGNTYYKYDSVGNLTNINYAISPDITLQYDPLNRVTNMVDAVGTTKYGYTDGSQLLTEDGPWSSDTVTNGYVNRLRMSLSLAQPTGSWTNGFGYDGAKRLTNVTSPAGVFGYGYSACPAPRVIWLNLPNTSYLTNTYDSVARLTGTFLKNSSHTTLNSHEYAYNAGQQRTQQVFNAGSTYDYSYDAIGQLKIADSATASEDRGYTYDAAWNLNYRTNNTTTSTFAVNNLNELTSGPGGTCTYDSNGNLLTSHTGRRTYVYDAENRLIEIYYSSHALLPPTNATVFVYDGLGRLRKRLEYHYENEVEDSLTVGEPEENLNLGEPEESLIGSGWVVDSETRYIYDGWRVIQERNGSNVPLVSYTRGTDLSGSLEGAGGIGGLLGRSHGYSSGNWTNHNFYHADGNGNITYLVDSSQTLAASYRYDPYGNTISSSGSLASDNTYQFSSKMIHATSDLYYYGYRWYAPIWQRWINRDPIEEDGGINLYGFVGNSSIQRIDADGRWVWWLLPLLLGGCSDSPPPPVNPYPGAPDCPGGATNKGKAGYTRPCAWSKDPNTGQVCVSEYCTAAGPGAPPPPTTPPPPPNKLQKCYDESRDVKDCADCIISAEPRIKYDDAYKLCEQNMKPK